MRFYLHYQADTEAATWTEEINVAELIAWLQQNANYPLTAHYDARSFAPQVVSARHTITRLS